MEIPVNIVELEGILMNALLVGDDPMLEALRKQYATAIVSRREFTGVGFFTDFTVSEATPRVNPPNFDIRDVFLRFENVESGAMAILAIRNGVIDYLEAVTYYDNWPNDAILQSIVYQSRKPEGSTQRDMEIVRKSWTDCEE